MLVTMKPIRGNSSPACHSTLALLRPLYLGPESVQLTGVTVQGLPVDGGGLELRQVFHPRLPEEVGEGVGDVVLGQNSMDPVLDTGLYLHQGRAVPEQLRECLVLMSVM